MVLINKGGEKGHSAISEVVRTPFTFTRAPVKWASRSMPLRNSETKISAMKEMGTSDVHNDQAQQRYLGKRNKKYHIPYPCAVVQKHNEH